MKKTTKVLALLLVATMAFSLAACTNTDAAIKQAQKSLSKVTSVDIEMSLDLAVTTNGVTEKANSTVQISSFLNPNKTKTVITTTTSNKEKQVVESYLIASDEENGKSVYYENVYNLEKQSDNLLSLVQKGDTWTATQIDDFASSAKEDFYISQEVIDMYAALVEDFEVLGKEQKFGLNHTVVQGVISGQTIMKAMLVNSDVLAGFSDSDAQELLAATDELSAMSITVKSWIQDSALYPVYTIIDMTALMNTLLEGDSITVDSCVLKMTMKNFNRATAFELPEAAKEAFASTQESDDAE